MITINIKKKINSVDDMYDIYISILESVSSLKFTEQEKTVAIEILKEREVTENVRKILYKKVGKARTGNILTTFRKKGIIKDNKIHHSFRELNENSVNFNITVTNE